MEQNKPPHRELLHWSWFLPRFLCLPYRRVKKKRYGLINLWRRILLGISKRLFCFDILEQFANIPACITLHELLYLFKKIKEALWDALANSETFLAQVPAVSVNEGTTCSQCYSVIQEILDITFSFEDMLIKDNPHDIPIHRIYWLCSYRENSNWLWLCSKHNP